jgi:arabinofuranosyltransferase
MAPAMPWTRHAFALFAALSFAGVALVAWPFTIDDAFIVARYADRLARGQGYTFNDGLVSDGVTGPLWLLPLTAGARVGLAPIAVAKAGSSIATLLALLLVVRRAQRRALGRRARWVVLLACCSSLPFVIWSVAGLETGLACLLATTLALAVTSRPRPSFGPALVAAAALPWLRPELVPYLGVLLLWLILRTRRAGLAVLAVALCSGLTLLAFRWLSFDHWLPMAASAKPASLVHGVSYVVDALLRPRAALIALLVLVACRMGGREAGLYTACLLAHALAVALGGGDWMPARRLFAPVFPIVALLLGAALTRLCLRRPAFARVGLVALVAVSALELVPELRRAREAGALQRSRGARLAELVCRARGPVVLVDIGLVGVSCPAQAFIDLGGLTEPRVAYARGGHLAKQLDGRWLEARKPGLFVLHSRERPRLDERRRVRWFSGYPIERSVLALPFVQRDYEARQVLEYAPSYYYVLLHPREDGQ